MIKTVNGANATVPNASNADVLEEQIFAGDIDFVTLEVTNTGQTLDVFTIQLKADIDGSFVSVVTAFSSVGPILKYYSVDFATLTSGSNGILSLDVKGCYSMKIIASCTSATTAVTVDGLAWSR